MHEHVNRQNTPAQSESKEEHSGASLAPPQFKLAAGGDNPPAAGLANEGPVQMQVNADAPVQMQVGQNVNNLAERIHTAIDGWGTDEEQVYLALNQVRGNAAVIDALKTRYETAYGESLEDAIRGDFSGSELDHALSLLNSGAAPAAAGNPAAAAAPDPHQVAADAIFAAVDGWGTDEEAIYAALEPYSRNLTAIHAIMDAYQATHGENMRDRLEDELSGTELEYALHLMGDQAMVANVEIQNVTVAEANELFAQLSTLNFWTDEGVEAPIPFHYPPDGCYARAHMMSQHLTSLGYSNEKVFAVSTKAGGLNVATDNAPDAGPGVVPSVTWWYHVAPIVNVTMADGSVVQHVMDPSMTSGPVPISTWTGMMRADAFEQRTAEEIRAQFNNGMPVDENLVYTANRDSFGPTDPRDADDPDPQGAHDSMESARGRMSDYAKIDRVHQLAAGIRSELRNIPPVADNIIGLFTHSTPEDRHIFRFGDGQFSNGFPHLIQQMENTFNAPDFARIEAAIRP